MEKKPLLPYTSLASIKNNKKKYHNTAPIDQTATKLTLCKLDRMGHTTPPRGRVGTAWVV